MNPPTLRLVRYGARRWTEKQLPLLGGRRRLAETTAVDDKEMKKAESTCGPPLTMGSRLARHTIDEVSVCKVA